MDLLAAHLARRQLTGSDPEALMFVNRDGTGSTTPHWRRRVWGPATRAAGLDDLGFHDLRRTAATALVQEHIDIKTAQTRLGHADARTTIGLYAHATRSADREAAERLGRRFHPPERRHPDDPRRTGSDSA